MRFTGSYDMIGFRVTKYDPRLRSENGAYLKNEWTSISDIGRTYSDGIFTRSDYLAAEEGYVESVRKFLAQTGIHSLRVSGLESKAFLSELETDAKILLYSLREGMEFSG